MAKLVKPLSDMEIKKAETKGKDYKLSDGKGLCLIVKSNGTKYFRFDFTYGSKRKSTSFGVYPTVTLKEAREKREEARQLLANNINPISAKRIKKASESLSLQNVIDEWIELRKKCSSEATVMQNLRILKNITNWLGNIAIKDIKRVDIINALEKMQNRGIIESAHRLLSIMNKIYMYAVTKEYIENNIIANIDKSTILVPNKKDTHLPALIEPKDIKQLLIDINSIGDKFKSDISTIFIFKIIPYVFVRSENIRLMCWDNLDLENGIWAIPKEKMKMKVDFVCPLPFQAIKILKQIEPFSKHRGKYVFPSPYKNDRGVSGATLSDTLNKLGYQNKHSFHGFRSMFSTIAHESYKEHGFHSDIIEACLAHKEKNKIKAAYNRESKFKYFEEKKELIQWYADWLDNLSIYV
jgi:integrase